MKEDERVSILFVEDDDSIRLTLRDYLVGKGYKVLVASDGVGALKILLDHEIDIIISDYRMNILGGDYWLKFLQRYCSEKKVIITSGFLKKDVKLPFDILHKPFDYSKLLELLSKDQ